MPSASRMTTPVAMDEPEIEGRYAPLGGASQRTRRRPRWRPARLLAAPLCRWPARYSTCRPCAVSQLAQMRGLSLPAIHKHIKVLEHAGLVSRRKHGRTTFLTLDRQPLQELQAWVGQFHPYWGSDQATFENYHQYLGITPGQRSGPSTSAESLPPISVPAAVTSRGQPPRRLTA